MRDVIDTAESTPPSRGPVAEVTTVSDQVLVETKADDPTRFEKFRKARTQERAGTDSPVTAQPSSESISTAPAREQRPPDPASKRQQKLTKEIQDAVTTATADRDAEITRLREQLAARPPAPQPVVAAEPVKPAPPAEGQPAPSDWDRFMALPDAPKQEQYKSFEAWHWDATRFVTGRQQAEVTARTSAAQDRENTIRYITERAGRSKTNSLADLKELGVDTSGWEDQAKANPQAYSTMFSAKLDELGVAREVRSLETFADLDVANAKLPANQRRQPTVLNAIAEEIAECQHPLRVMQELSKPGELTRIASLKTVRDVIAEIAGIDRSLGVAASLRTKAPDPITALTTASNNGSTESAEDRAMREHNVTAFRKATMSRRIKEAAETQRK